MWTTRTRVLRFARTCVIRPPTFRSAIAQLRKYSTEAVNQLETIEHPALDPFAELKDLEDRLTTLQRLPQDESVVQELNEITLKTATVHQFCGNFKKGLELLTTMRERVVQQFGEDSFENCSLLHDIAILHDTNGQTKEAEKQMLQAFEFVFKANEVYNKKPTEDTRIGTHDGKDNSRSDPLIIAQTLLCKISSSLGSLFEKQKQAEQASHYYYHAALNLPEIPQAHTNFAADSAYYCTLLNPLVANAAPYYHGAAVNEEHKKFIMKSRDPNKLDLIEAMNSSELAEIDPLVTQLAEMQAKTLSIREKILGEFHPALISSLANTAWAHVNSGDTAVAEDLYKRILSIDRRIHGYETPHSANALQSLGIINYYAGNFKEAQDVIQKAIRIKKKFYIDVRHPQLGILYYDLGHVMLRTDKEAGIIYLSKARDIFKDNLPNRMAGRRHIWHQLALEAMCAALNGTPSLPPIRDYDQPESELQFLYDRIDKYKI